MQKCLYILFLCLGCFLLQAQNADDSTRFVPQYQQGATYTIKTRNGELHTGQVKKETRDTVILENRLTHRTTILQKNQIIRINRLAERNERAMPEDILGENPHAKSYMFLSSAFLFDAKCPSTNSHWLLLENIDYAFTENWAIGINTIAFYPVTAGVKCSYQLMNDNYIGANIFGIGNISTSSGGGGLWGYGAQGKFTKGTSNKNVTLSAGILGLSSEFLYSSSGPFVNMAFVSAGFCNRFSKKVALSLEGWYLPEANAGLGGAGIKFVGDETTCWTFGCYVFTNNQDHTVKLDLKTLPVPYFGVSRRFR